MLEYLFLVRCAIVVCLVAALGGLLSHFEQTRVRSDYVDNRVESTLVDTSTWVRTVDGWEPPEVLQVELPEDRTSRLHPSLVAFFQLGASLFALLAFPAAKSPSQRKQEASDDWHWDVLAGIRLLRS